MAINFQWNRQLHGPHDHEFQTAARLTRFRPFGAENFVAIFSMVLRKPVTGNNVSLTTDDLDKLHRFGVALEG